MNTIMQEWADMLKHRNFPLFEWEIIGGEYIIVNLNVTETSLEFDFDIKHGEPRFDGDVLGENGHYRVEYDPESDTLDRLLEYVMDNVTEGYMAVYDLYPLDDE